MQHTRGNTASTSNSIGTCLCTLLLVELPWGICTWQAAALKAEFIKFPPAAIYLYIYIYVVQETASFFPSQGYYLIYIYIYIYTISTTARVRSKQVSYNQFCWKLGWCTCDCIHACLLHYTVHIHVSSVISLWLPNIYIYIQTKLRSKKVSE